MRILSGSTKIAFGVGLGIVAAEVLKDVLPAFRGLGRPLLKATVKSGLMLAQDSRLKLAEFRQVLTEVAAEAKTELAREEAEVPPKRSYAKAAETAAGVM
jgi:hypothetical protein